MENLSTLIPLSIYCLLAGTAIQAAEDSPTIAFSGRIQGDHTRYNGGNFSYTDGSEVRRGRAGVSGNLTSDWEYKIEYEFAPEDPEVKDVYFRYTGLENTRMKHIGQ